MAGPWEKYQQAPAEDGPWARYAQAPDDMADSTPANDSDLARLIAGRPKQRSTAEEIGHQFSYQGREFLNGVGGLVGLVNDPIAAGMEKLGLPRGYRGRELSGMAADALGLDHPETAQDRIYGDVQNALGGTAASFGLGALASNAGRIGNSLGRVLTDRPALQAVSAGSGAAAGGLVREGGGSDGAQLGASILGSLLPGGVPAAKGLTRVALRGGEAGRQNVLDTLEAFRLAGTTPTVAQATQGRVARAVESGLASYPGSAGVMARKAEQQAAEVGAKVNSIADRLAPGADPVSAGAAIKRGITGNQPNSFQSRAGATSDQLYSVLDELMPDGRRVGVQNTDNVLATLNPEITGAPNMSPFFQNSRIAGIKGGFTADTQGIDAALSRPEVRQWAEDMHNTLRAQAQDIAEQNTQRRALMLPELPVPTEMQIADEVRARVAGMVDGNLPYEAVRKTRTLVGRELADKRFNQDVPKEDWKAIYGGLTADMRAAAAGEGPKASRAFGRATNHFRATQGRADVIDSVVNAGTPEKVYQAAIAGTEGGATQLTALMKSLPKDAQQTVAATVIKRMGRATNGMQNEAGDVFSSQTFLTNWNKLSPQAKTALFVRLPPQMQREIGAIAKLGANVRDGSKVFANPSGSGSKVLQLLGASGIGGALASGNVPIAAGLAATAAGANGLGRWMANGRGVRFIAGQTQVPAYLLPGAVNGSSK